ncbi:MFS transporter [Candidatus Jidaibacter acanthamoebae]|nr:MFS transporter [Candidatus Jidaibacter acanthamoeba]
MSNPKNIKYLPFFMWFLPLSFFAYQFILRLWPGLMMHQIMEQFSIDAGYFGLLAAFYYYGYAGMQIPVAILLDRFSARYIIFAFAVLCGLATLLFTYTTNFYLAVLSRFLIGAGSAVGFLGISKVVSQWFPKEQYGRMIGFSFTFGLMGAIYGGKPVSLLVANYSWQNVALALAAISIVIGCTTYLALRSPENAKESVKEEQFKITNFKVILSSPVIWYLALANLLMVGTLEGFADVWGVQYLMTAYNLKNEDAAGLMSLVFFGMLFGGPVLALGSKKLGNYPMIAICGFSMAGIFMILLLSQTYNPLLLSCLLFALGVMCCYQVLVFAAGSNLVAPQNLGVAIAFLNCMNMLGGSFFHTIIGKTMDMFWTGALSASGFKIYDLEVYKYSLSIIPICACLGAIMVCLVGHNVKGRYMQHELQNRLVEGN